MSFYGNMQATATRLLNKFQQGTIAYIDTPMTGDAWNPTPGTPVEYALAATVSGASDDYVDGKAIFATDLLVIAAVFGAVPSLTGQLRIDGNLCEIVAVYPIPAAGETVAWKLIVRA